MILFSGRFEIPHSGHWITILRLLNDHDKVKIVILDYPGKKWPSSVAKQIFSELIELSDLAELISVEINKTHFAKITLTEFKKFGCNEYASGNMDCLKHISKIGIPVYYTDRAYDYAASNYIPKSN